MSEHENLFAPQAEVDLEEAPKLSEENNALKTLSNLLAHLKDDKAAVETKLEEINKQITKVTDDLLTRMKAANITGFKTPRGNFFTRVDTYASVADPVTAFAWLREHELGAIIKETIHSKTLSSTIKELVAENVVTLDGLANIGLNCYTKETISLRKK